MPKEYPDALDGMRAMTDFWANVWFLSLLIILENVVLKIWALGGFEQAWTLLVRLQNEGALLTPFQHQWIVYSSIVVAFIASWQARISAAEWGEWVKAAFDIFLPELCNKLGFQRPLARKAEREFWKTVSQAIVYRHAASLDKLDPLRENK